MVCSDVCTSGGASSCGSTASRSGCTAADARVGTSRRAREREEAGSPDSHELAFLMTSLSVRQPQAWTTRTQINTTPLPRNTARGVRSGSVVVEAPPGWAAGITTPMTRGAGDTALPSPGVDEARPDAAPRQAGESTVPRTRGNRKELEATRRREASDIVI